MKLEETERKRPKRLSREQIDAAILNTAFDDVLEYGFRAVSIDSISAKTGIAKTSIYRRWPNKAALVMDAFLRRIGPGIMFPKSASPVESIRLQMLALAKAFRGPFGKLTKALLGEAQFDAELAEAYLSRWIVPRRTAAKQIFNAAIDHGELRPGIDLDEALDALYGGLYYRLMIGSGPLSDAYVRGTFAGVMNGLALQTHLSHTPTELGKRTSHESNSNSANRQSRGDEPSGDPHTSSRKRRGSGPR
jgi:AcrR family transcriptional regulator